MRRSSAAAAVALSAVVLLTACTDTPPNNETPAPQASAEVNDQRNETPDAFVDFNSFVDEYQNAANDLESTLPPGYGALGPVSGDWDEDGQFEPGAGEMQAAFAWQCAWIAEYAHATENLDATARSTALDRLAEWTELSEVAPHTDDASKQVWADQVIAPARTGEDSFLLEFAGGCEW